MNFSEYISFVYLGEERENELQYVTKENKSFYDDNLQALIRETGIFYISTAFPNFWNTKPSNTFRFLNFHFAKYKGEPIDFLYMVRDVSNALSAGDYDISVWSMWQGKFPIENMLEEWVMDKKHELAERKRLSRLSDTRISGSLTTQEIQSFFIERFVKATDKQGTPYFNEAEVMQFLRANISGFEPIVPIAMLKSKAKNARGYINMVIHDFFLQNSFLNSEATKYASLLKDNFIEFKKSDFKGTILKGFSRKVVR